MEGNREQKGNETVSIVGFIFSFLIPLIGLILSIIGLSKSKKNNSNNGLAIAGLIISIFGLLIRVLLVLAAIFSFMSIKSTAGDFINDTTRNMCAKVQKCENIFGDYYSCTYKKGNVDYTIPCNKNKIPDGIIDGNDENDFEEIEENGFSLEELEKIALTYYEIKNNEKLMKAVATNLEDNMVEIKLYRSLDDLNNPMAIYTIDKDTLVGKDANGLFVDLTEGIVDDV